MRNPIANFQRISLARSLCAVSAASAIASSTLASAQEPTQWTIQEQRGMFHAAPIGLLQQSPSGGTTVQELLVSGTTLTGTLPAPWTTARFGPAGDKFPDYSLGMIREGIERGLPILDASTLQLGGISSGGDIMPGIAANGNMAIGNGVSWYFLSVLVDNGPGALDYGEPDTTLSSLLSPEHSVLSYYLEGNTIVAKSLRNAVAVEETHGDLGFTPSDPRVIAGIDRGIGAIAHDPDGSRTQWLANSRKRIFFSVTQDWITANELELNAAVLSSGTLSEFTAATVFEMEWVDLGAQGWGWTNLAVTFERNELLGPSPTNGEGETLHPEIDALSVYVNEQRSIERVIFSTTLESVVPDELMGYDANWLVPNTAVPIRTGTGVFMSERLGLRRSPRRDNVTGTCGGDPEGVHLSGAAGTPVNANPNDGFTDIGLSVFRSKVVPASDSDVQQGSVSGIHFDVSGIRTDTDTSLTAWLDLGLVDQVDLNMGNYEPATWYELMARPIPSGSHDFHWDVPEPPAGLGKVAWRIRIKDQNGRVVAKTCISLLAL